MKQQYEAWCQKFFAAKQEPMNEGLSKVFLACSFNEKDPNFPGQQICEQFMYQLIERRSAFCGLKITPAVITLISMICESPGDGVMYVHALRSKQVDVNMDNFANFFPWGYPSRDTLSTLWDAQKGHVLGLECDNMLDKIGNPYPPVKEAA